MRRIVAVLTTLLLLASFPVVNAAAAGTDPPANSANLKAWTADVPAVVVQVMREAGIDITAQESLGDGVERIEVIATSKQLQPFRSPDVQFRKTKGQERVERTPDVNTGDNVFRPYDGPEGLEAEILAVASDNPDLVKLVDIGDTVEGRDIWALKVSKNANLRPDGTKPAVLYNAAQHAREWITPEMTRRLTRYYLDNYGFDAEITDLVDNNELWFVWVANPDGYQWTHEDPANRLWRKNLADNDGDGVITTNDGVDLNRNFAYKWGYDNEGSSPNFNSATYRGPGPMSEPETVGMDGLLASVDFSFMVNYHSAAELILYGVGWQVDTPSPDDVVQIALAGDDANPAIPGYDPDQSAELYITNGATTGHVHNVHGTLGYTPEMSTCQTISNLYDDDEWEAGDCQSGFNFPDDEDLIEEEFQNNLPFALDIARSAADPSNPVSHLGNVAPEIVVDEFTQSNGTEQIVQINADRELGMVRMYYSINGGMATKVNTVEWDGGERYGAENDLYYHWRRGTVTGQQPGDEVSVWFAAKQVETEPFSYTVADDIGGEVLIVADNSSGSALGGEVPWDAYLPYYTNAIEANGHTWDVYEVNDDGVAPHALGVLSHYDAVVWYTGDKLVTDYQGGLNTTYIAHEMNMVMRDYMNEGGKILATGKNHGFEEFFPLNYGENSDPQTPCTSGNCLVLTDDVYQYWFGAYTRTRRGGLDLVTQNALDLTGIDTPYDGYDWTLDGGDSANNQGSSDGTNTTGTATAAWGLTSDFLPVDEFPQFESWPSADWVSSGGPFEPLTGDFYMASQSDNAAWKRLATTVDLTGASSGSVEINLSYDIESPYWDFLIFEVHTVGQDDWTTLEVPGLTSQGLADGSGGNSSCASGWQEQLHPQIERYQTLNPDGTCSPTGTTGEWNAVAGSGNGWETWNLDLSAYAGSEVELVISYVTDWGTLGTGVFIDDTSVIVDGATVRETSFEDDLGGWEILGPPEGSAGGDPWIRTTALIVTWAAITTPNTVLHGFGFEGVTSEAERTEIMRRTLEFLLP